MEVPLPELGDSEEEQVWEQGIAFSVGLFFSHLYSRLIWIYDNQV